jgi:hypothetical protein
MPKLDRASRKKISWPTPRPRTINRKGAAGNVEAIAKQFGAGNVVALREQGFGFGAIVKLLTLAKAKNTNAKDLAA